MAGDIPLFKKITNWITGNDEENANEKEDYPSTKYTKTSSMSNQQKPIDSRPLSSSSNTQKKPQNSAHSKVQTSHFTNSTDYKLIVIYPDKFEDCERLVHNLQQRKPIIVNFTHMSHEIGRRCFDFLNGAVYALEGTTQQVGENIYVFAPFNIDVDMDNSKEQQNDEVQKETGNK